MKRIFFIAAIGLAIFSGCKKDNREYDGDGDMTQGYITVITAAMPNDGNTKLALSGENHHQVQWTEGDVIYIAEVEANAFKEPYVFNRYTAKTVDEGGKSATFEVQEGMKPLVAGRTYVAFHKENHSGDVTFIKDGKLTHNVPTSVTQQNYRGEFYDIDRELFFISAPVTAASDEAPAFVFRHVMSMLEFEIWTDEPEYFSGFIIDRVLVQSGIDVFVKISTFDSDGKLATGAATNMLTALLRERGLFGYDLDETHRKLRMPFIWNSDVKPPSEFTFTLYPQSGEPIVFTQPAKKLEPGMIYRIQMQATPDAGPDKTVRISERINGTINEGTAGSLSFNITTRNIADGETGTVQWYSDLDGTGVAKTPIGISSSVSAVARNSARVTMTATTAAREGEYYFKVTIDGTQSAMATMPINPPE